MIVAPPPSFVFTMFRNHTSDGVVRQELCNGHHHIEIDPNDEDHLVITACDETEPHSDHIEIFRMMKDIKKECFMHAPGVFFGSEIVLDAGMKKVLKKRSKLPWPFNEHLIGIVFKSSRGKRRGSSVSAHVHYDFDVHITVETTCPCMTDESSTTFQIHKFTAVPCDGSCRRTLDVTPELMCKLADFDDNNH